MKVYNIATTPVAQLEAGEHGKSFLHAMDGIRGQPFHFFLVVKITNSGLRMLGNKVKNCQINSHLPCIWGDCTLQTWQMFLVSHKRSSFSYSIAAWISACEGKKGNYCKCFQQFVVIISTDTEYPSSDGRLSCEAFTAM